MLDTIPAPWMRPAVEKACPIHQTLNSAVGSGAGRLANCIGCAVDHLDAKFGPAVVTVRSGYSAELFRDALQEQRMAVHRRDCEDDRCACRRTA